MVVFACDYRLLRAYLLLLTVLLPLQYIGIERRAGARRTRQKVRRRGRTLRVTLLRTYIFLGKDIYYGKGNSVTISLRIKASTVS